MKQLILLLTLFSFATIAIAQPKNDRLDADLKRLTRRFENVESIKRLESDGNTEVRIKRAIQSAENELGRFKKKYPDHNVSKFEEDLANFKNPQNISANDVDKDITPNSNGEVSDYAKVENLIESIEEILDFRHDPRKFIQNDETALESSKQQLSGFREKMGKIITPEFITLANDVSNRKIKRTLDKVNREAKTLQTNLSTVDTERISEESDQNLMLSKYFNVLFEKEKINLLSKIYKDLNDLATANNTADNLISELGTLDQIEQKGKANYAAKVAKNRMFPERQNNSALRNEAIRAFNSSVYRAKESGNKVLKAHLVSSGWSVERNKVTGIILSRDQQVQIAYKSSDGKCYTYLMLFMQKHLGGGKYGVGFDRSGSVSEILCENVSK